VREYTPDSRSLSILMPSYRATFRYGGQRPRYAMIDVEADDLRSALRAAADRVADDVAATAELVEVRLQADPDAREYVEEEPR
jgi:hypothetical protein